MGTKQKASPESPAAHQLPTKQPKNGSQATHMLPKWPNGNKISPTLRFVLCSLGGTVEPAVPASAAAKLRPSWVSGEMNTFLCVLAFHPLRNSVQCY